MYRIAGLAADTGNVDRYIRAEKTGKRYARNIVKYLQSQPERQSFSFLNGGDRLRQAIDFDTKVGRGIYAPNITNASKANNGG